TSTEQTAAEIAKAGNIKQLILNHITSRYQQEDALQLLHETRTIFANTELAKDFYRLPIKREGGINMELQTLVNKQKKFFLTKQTLNATYRKKQLKTMKKMLKTYEEPIYQALKKDLNKSKHETLTTELGVVYAEIDFALKHLNE